MRTGVGGLLAGGPIPLDLDPPDVAIDSDEQIGLGAEVHGVVPALVFADDVLDLDFGVLFGQQQAGVGVVDLALLDDEVLLVRVFLAVVLHVHPEFVLVVYYLLDLGCVIVGLYLIHYLAHPVAQPDFFLSLVLVFLCQELLLFLLFLFKQLLFVLFLAVALLHAAALLLAVALLLAAALLHAAALLLAAALLHAVALLLAAALGRLGQSLPLLSQPLLLPEQLPFFHLALLHFSQPLELDALDHQLSANSQQLLHQPRFDNGL